MSLSEAGYTRKRLDEIKLELDALAQGELGAVNTNADSVIGQLLGIEAEAIDDLEEKLQSIYDAMYPYSAEGTSLDGSVSFIGLTRLEATKTIANCVAYGTEGTQILAGATALADITYINTDDAIISRTNTVDATISVNSVIDNDAYSIFAAGITFTYTSDASATSEEIIAGLITKFDSNNDINASLVDGNMRLVSADGKTPFNLTLDTKLTLESIGSAIQFIAEFDGSYTLPAGALTNIQTGKVNGWDSLDNLTAGLAGRNRETDSELRARHAISTRGTGSATIEAMRARLLQDVESVTNVSIFENRRGIEVDGVPSHSFEAVIEGGADSDIGEKLWLIKPAGIESFGSTSVNVTDSNGETQSVSFSRPQNRYAWLNIVIIPYSEEVVPAGASTAIKQACIDYALAYMPIGKDLIPQRFFGAIYEAVGGIGNIDITADLTDLPTDTPSYQTGNIAIDKRSVALLDFDRIFVSGV